MMLMEDVELSMRLKQAGRVLYLKEGVSASGRRWRKQKFSKNFIMQIAETDTSLIRVWIYSDAESDINSITIGVHRGDEKKFGDTYYGVALPNSLLLEDGEDAAALDSAVSAAPVAEAPQPAAEAPPAPQPAAVAPDAPAPSTTQLPSCNTTRACTWSSDVSCSMDQTSQGTI